MSWIYSRELKYYRGLSNIVLLSAFYLLIANTAIEKWGSCRTTSKYCLARRTCQEISNSSAAVEQDIRQDLSLLFSGNCLTGMDNLGKG
jgi:hypothetical protein